MKKYLMITCVLLVSVTSFGQDTLKKSPVAEEIRYLNIVENGFNGNIVVDVVDENNVPVKEYRTILRAGDDVVFDVSQDGPRSVFYRDGSGLTLQIEKKGYKTYFSKPLTMDDQMEMACVIKIILIREK